MGLLVLVLVVYAVRLPHHAKVHLSAPPPRVTSRGILRHLRPIFRRLLTASRKFMMLYRPISGRAHSDARREWNAYRATASPACAAPGAGPWRLGLAMQAIASAAMYGIAEQNSK
jgi:hypothetical protein